MRVVCVRLIEIAILLKYAMEICASEIEAQNNSNTTESTHSNGTNGSFPFPFSHARSRSICSAVCAVEHYK